MREATSGIMKKEASSCPFARYSAPRSVSSTLPVFLIYGKQQWLVCQVHVLILLLHVVVFRFWSNTLTPSSLKNLMSGRYLGSARCTRNRAIPASPSWYAGLSFGKQVAGFGQILRSQFALCFQQAFYKGLQFQIFLVFSALCYRAGDNQRRTGVVDEYGVHFVHHSKVVFALHHFFGE
jgi:hypothetical protein